MRARVKRNGGHVPVVCARMFDMLRVTECRGEGVPAMDVVVYLPEALAYAMMKRRVVLYRDDRGAETAIIFTGVQINLDDENLRFLCDRLAAAKENLVACVRRLAQL